MSRPERALPYRYLIPLALLLGLAPFRPEPHLIETGLLRARPA